MVLRIYGILSLIFIAIAIIYAVFEYEVFKRPRQTTKKLFSIIVKILIVYAVLFTIYLIFMIIYGITNGDSFKKIILVEKSLKPKRDEHGYVTMGIREFLLDPNSLEM